MRDDVERSEAAGDRVASPDWFDLLLIQGALDSLGVALADHGHTWTDGEREIYDQATELISSSVSGCMGSDSSASEIFCSQKLSSERHLRGVRVLIQSLVSEYSLWRVASVVLLLIGSNVFRSFVSFCSSCFRCGGCGESNANVEDAK